ncbi:hypothetical protein ZWY2020_022012 [Hordeum vulgare]|nr:hypothetical protein ZWY2020_022012 [Hordeum vulgare]
MRSSRFSRSDRVLLPSLPTTTSSGRSLPHRATTSGRSEVPSSTSPPSPLVCPCSEPSRSFQDPAMAAAPAPVPSVSVPRGVYEGLHLASDSDEQMLIYIPFMEVIKLHSALFKGPEEEGYGQLCREN